MGFPYHPRPMKAGWNKGELHSSNMNSEGTDQGWRDSTPHGSGAAAGSGTEVSGYVESPVEKRCGTCEYLENGKFCNQETVLKDPEVQNSSNGLKIVDPKNGCCSFWEADETGSRQQSHEALDQPKDKPRTGATSLKPASERRREGSDEKAPKLRMTFY